MRTPVAEARSARRLLTRTSLRSRAVEPGLLHGARSGVRQRSVGIERRKATNPLGTHALFACGSRLTVLLADAIRYREGHHPAARRDERARAVAARDPRHVDVGGATTRTRPRRAVARVAVVADELDGR